MCLNKTFSTVQVGKHFSDRFPIKNGLKQGDALSYVRSKPLKFKFAQKLYIHPVHIHHCLLDTVQVDCALHIPIPMA